MTAKAIDTIFRGVDRVSAVTSKISASMDRMGSRFSVVTSRMNRAASTILGPLKGMLPMLTAAGIFEFANNAIEKFAQAQVNVEMFNNALEKSTIGMTADEFKRLNTELSKTSVFGAGKITANISTPLIRMGNISKTILPQVEQSVLDVASGMYKTSVSAESLTEVSNKLGRILASPFDGMKQLRRMNIVLTDAQKAHMKQLQKNNDLMGGQKYLLDIVAQKYGGASKALANTEWGKHQQIQNQINANMIKIGGALMPVKEQLTELALKVLPYASKAVDFFAQNSSWLIPVLTGLAGAIGLAAIGIKAFNAATAVMKIASMVTEFAQYTKAFGLVETVAMKAAAGTSVWTAAQWLLNIAMDSNPIGLIIAAVGVLISLAVVITKKWKTFGAALTMILGPTGMTIAAFASVYNSWDRIKKAFTTGGIRAGINAIGQALIDAFVYPLQQLFEMLSKIKGLGTSAGKYANLIKGFRERFLGADKETETEAPNKTDAKTVVRNQTSLVVNNALPGTTVDTFPKFGATVDMSMMGGNF